MVGLLVACGSAKPSSGHDAGASAGDATPDTGTAPPPPGGSITFTIDMAKGPVRQFQPPAQPATISPYVYGINGFGTFVARATRWGLIRQGGDAFTAWNWTTNDTNSGSDYCFYQGNGGVSGVAGSLVQGGDSIPNAQAKGEAFLATVPILEHVSSTVGNNTGIDSLCPQEASNCNGGMAESTGINSGNLDFVSTDPNSQAFVPNIASKGAAFCTCPGPACGSGCSVPTTGTVFADELANYLRVSYGAGLSPILLMLDNEPNYWGGTHPELWPYMGALPCQTSTVTYDDIVSRDKAFAAAIKTAWPTATLLGPVVAQEGIVFAHTVSDPHLPMEFSDYYLAQMAAASASFGRPLIDSFDVHYYNSGSTDPAQCVQNPRMFWDPSYTSLSPSATDQIDFGYSGPNGYFDTSWYPRQVIPRLLRKIANAYGSAQAPGLSFSEYSSGCEDGIAGGVAEADNLGIFGREGVFAATAWPLQSLMGNYLVAAFDAYRNYDGNGAIVGDTAVSALTSDATNSSVYAFAQSTDAGVVDLVLINKAPASTTASISIAHSPQLSAASAYNLVDGAASVVPALGGAQGLSCGGGVCVLGYTMPALSVTTLALK